VRIYSINVGLWALCFVRFPEIKAFEDLGLPTVVKTLCDKPRGLILVTGPTGSGKSTTLAAMIDRSAATVMNTFNYRRSDQFLHNHKGCLISQREVNADTHGLLLPCVPHFVRILRSSGR
jgi:twitching motility protein PilT